MTGPRLIPVLKENYQDIFNEQPEATKESVGASLQGIGTGYTESVAGCSEGGGYTSQQKLDRGSPRFFSFNRELGFTVNLQALGIDAASLGFIDGIASEEENANIEGKNLINASVQGMGAHISAGMLLARSYGGDFGQGYAQGIMDQVKNVAAAAAALVRAGAGTIKSTQKSNSPSKLTRGLGTDFSEGYELGIADNEENVQETVESWMHHLRNQVTAFSQMPVDVEIARPDFPAANYSASVASISSNTVMTPIKAELEMGLEPYMKEVSRQNALLEEQNKLLKDIREKPVIQDSDVFSSYRRGQQSYFARTGRVGISGID